MGKIDGSNERVPELNLEEDGNLVLTKLLAHPVHIIENMSAPKHDGWTVYFLLMALILV